MINYCSVVPSETGVEVKEIIIKVSGKNIKLTKEKAVGLRDFLLSVFPKETSSWTYSTDCTTYITPDTTTWCEST